MPSRVLAVPQGPCSGSEKLSVQAWLGALHTQRPSVGGCIPHPASVGPGGICRPASTPGRTEGLPDPPQLTQRMGGSVSMGSGRRGTPSESAQAAPMCRMETQAPVHMPMVPEPPARASCWACRAVTLKQCRQQQPSSAPGAKISQLSQRHMVWGVFPAARSSHTWKLAAGLGWGRHCSSWALLPGTRRAREPRPCQSEALCSSLLFLSAWQGPAKSEMLGRMLMQGARGHGAGEARPFPDLYRPLGEQCGPKRPTFPQLWRLCVMGY